MMEIILSLHYILQSDIWCVYMSIDYATNLQIWLLHIEQNLL